MSDLRERMRDAELPDERGAEERGWRVVRAAFDERPARRRRPATLRLALAAAALAAVVLAVPATGASDWLRDLVRPGRDDARPSLSSLPGGGRLLVTSEKGAWVVRADGSKRLLGAYREAGWSPRGLFVIATHGRQLVALEPGGRVRWTVSRPDAVRHPRWSPSGWRIAYVTGVVPSLRVVAGDGTEDRGLTTGVADSPPAWKPGPIHVIAYSTLDGSVRAVATDERRTLWRSAPAEAPRELVWSPDGRRLLAVGSRSVRVFDDRGRLLRTIPTSGVSGHPRAAAFAGRGHDFALVQAAATPGQSEVVLLEAERRAPPPRRVFVGAGELGALAWSPDGRWLLIGWPSADQWLFVRSHDARRIVAVSEIGRQFSPGAAAALEAPRIADWCCTR
jgi:dipeptidyl aminopeptidase/acylaminoacyl peptidase